MKQPILKSLLILQAAGLWSLMLLFSSCSDNSTLNKVPASAEWVVYADFKKLAIQAFSIQDLFDLQGKSSNQGKSGDEEEVSWNDLGIDMLSKAVVFQKPIGEDKKLGIVMIPLSNKTDFLAFCEKKGKFKPDNTLGEGWISNGKIAVFAAENLAAGFLESEKVSSSILKAELDSLLNQSGSSNLLKNSKGFEGLVSEGKSLAYWANTSSLMDGSANPFQPDFLRGELCSSIDFQTGQLVMDARLTPEESQKGKSIMGNPLTTELLNEGMKGSKSPVFLAFSLSVRKIFDLLNSSQFGAGADEFLRAYGISRDDLINELTGEIAVSMIPGNGKAIVGTPEIRMLIGTRNGPDNLINSMVKSGILSPSTGGNYKMNGMNGYLISKTGRTISIQPENHNPAADSPDENLAAFLLKEPSVMAGSIDFENFDKTYPTEKQSPQAAKVIGKWSNLFFRMKSTEDASIQLNLSINCRNEDQSSLLALIETFKLISGEPDEKKQQTSMNQAF